MSACSHDDDNDYDGNDDCSDEDANDSYNIDTPHTYTDDYTMVIMNKQYDDDRITHIQYTYLPTYLPWSLYSDPC